MRGWRNRQTRTFEGRVVIPCEFKSRSSHQKGRLPSGGLPFFVYRFPLFFRALRHGARFARCFPARCSKCQGRQRRNRHEKIKAPICFVSACRRRGAHAACVAGRAEPGGSGRMRRVLSAALRHRRQNRDRRHRSKIAGDLRPLSGMVPGRRSPGTRAPERGAGRTPGGDRCGCAFQRQHKPRDRRGAGPGGRAVWERRYRLGRRVRFGFCRDRKRQLCAR